MFRSIAQSSMTNECTSVQAVSTLEMMRRHDTADIDR
jgi:hypothetical protein